MLVRSLDRSRHSHIVNQSVSPSTRPSVHSRHSLSPVTDQRLAHPFAAFLFRVCSYLYLYTNNSRSRPRPRPRPRPRTQDPGVATSIHEQVASETEGQAGPSVLQTSDLGKPRLLFLLSIPLRSSGTAFSPLTLLVDHLVFPFPSPFSPSSPPSFVFNILQCPPRTLPTRPFWTKPSRSSALLPRGCDCRR